ncbi:MAG: acyl-CoA thioesterase [Actinomycetia bacterium]|nr:acyl-CoA thioesterase [Actinomycetes bacterium]
MTDPTPLTSHSFLGAETTDDPHGWNLPVTPAVGGGMGQLFGGCALGLAIEQLETMTDRPAAWATGQFISNAFPPEVVTFEASLAAEGRNFAQGRVVGHAGGREVLTAHVALGQKSFDGEGQWVTMPAVPGPEDSPARIGFGPSPGQLHHHLDQRIASGEWGDEVASPTGQARVWMRAPGHLIGSTVGLAIAADFLPFAIRAAFGRRLFGTSLDNTIRYADRADGLQDPEWILADVQVERVSHGVGHGTSHLWSQDGRLLAIASQTCSLRELPG